MKPARASATIVAFSFVLVGALVAPSGAQPAEEVDQTGVEVHEGMIVAPSWKPPAADVWEPEPLEDLGEVGAPPDEPWVPAGLGESAQESGFAARLGGPPSYNARGGDRGYDTFHDFSMDADEGRQQIRVNIGSGNLFIRSTLTELAGPGVPIRADRIYNSRGTGPKAGSQNGVSPWWTDFSQTGLYIYTDNAPVFSDGTGASWQFHQSGSGYTKPAGLNATLTEEVPDERYRLTYDKTGDSLIFNHNGWLLERYDRNGIGVTYGYTGSQITSITDAAGKSVSLFYTGTGANTRLTTAGTPGRDTTLAYDSANRLSTINEPARLQWQMTYNTAGRLATMSGAGRTIAFEYDNRHRVTKVTQSRSGETSVVTSFAYTETGTVVTDPRGNTSTFEVDAQQRVTKTIDQLGRERSQTWTANSDVSSSTDGFSTGGGQGNEITSTYDDLNNQTSITLPTGVAVQAQYAVGPDCPGAQDGNPHRVKCQTDTQGNSSSMEYDEAGNLTKRSDTTPDGVGAVFSYTYDDADGTVCGGMAGQICTATDPLGNVTSYKYSDGMITRVTPPAPLGATTYTHDMVGRVASVTDGNGHTTRYTYDAADRITRTTYDNGQTFTVVYNPDGTIASETDSSNAVTVAAHYNLLGNKTREQTSFATTGRAPAIAATVLSSYDAAGNMTSTTETGVINNYVYDSANQLIRTHPLFQPCAATGTPAANSGCVKFTYDNNGQETTRLLPGGARQDTTYDDSGRITRVTAKDAAGTVRSDIGYTFERDGQDTGQLQTRSSHLEQGITPGAVTSYEYDSLNRLTSAIETAGASTTASWQYAYDAASNRTNRTYAGDTGGQTGTIDYTFNDAHQIVSSTNDIAPDRWLYDGAGNQRRSGERSGLSSYGDRQQVTWLTGGLSVGTFGDGNARRLSLGNTTRYLNTDLGVARQQLVDGSELVRYYRDPSGALISYTTDNTARYFTTDHQNTVVGMFSATGAWLGGYSYSPYGERRHGASNIDIPRNVIGYISGPEDQADLYKLGSRYYDARLGRFTQMDPAGQAAAPYSYASCDPINRVDETGLCDKTLAVIAATAGVIGFGLVAATNPWLFLTGLYFSGMSTGIGVSSVFECY